MTEFKTDVIQTKTYDVNKGLMLGFAILYIAATYYIFIFADDVPNTYLEIGAFIIYVSGLYFLYQNSLKPPKKRGMVLFSENRIHLLINGKQHEFPYSDLEHIQLNYAGFKEWHTNTYGNRNYISLKTASGAEQQFEFMLQNDEQRQQLKKILRQSALKSKLDIISKAPVTQLAI